MQSRILIILCLLVVIVIRNMSRANAEGSQLSKSQRAIGVGDGQEDRYVRKLQERHALLTINNLLVAPHNLKALIHHIHTLTRAPACGQNTSEILQDAEVGTRSGGGTTTAGSAGRSSSSSGSTSTRSHQILGHCWVKRIVSSILVELLLGDHLNHVLDVWSKAT
jgi:hypothetical protein